MMGEALKQDRNHTLDFVPTVEDTTLIYLKYRDFGIYVQDSIAEKIDIKWHYTDTTEYNSIVSEYKAKWFYLTFESIHDDSIEIDMSVSTKHNDENVQVNSDGNYDVLFTLIFLLIAFLLFYGKWIYDRSR